MLTADLVPARRRAGALHVPALKPKQRERAGEIAAAFVGVLERMPGESREDILRALDGVSVAANERRLSQGLRKLLLDRCDFSMSTQVDPVTLRREVFTAAAAARRDDAFDRDALVTEAAARHSCEPEVLESLLYADLKDAHRLLSFDAIEAGALVSVYEAARYQAVLLRATRVDVEIRATHPSGYRRLFQKMKFLQLLYRLEKLPEDAGYRLRIDGPFSLFSAVTRYGLKLALLLPVLDDCGAWRLEAEVLWGADKTPLKFELEGGAAEAQPRDAALVSDEVQTLLEQLNARSDVFEVTLATEILDLPGVGNSVPDLCFTPKRGHKRGRKRVFLELLGFWSRDAVWRRVELVQLGLGERVLFCVSSRLRVSEAALDADEAGALYVFKGVMSAKKILEKVDALSRKSGAAAKGSARPRRPRR